MSWTYVDPTADRKDEVRFMVGDTDTTQQLVQDEEIEYVLTQAVPEDGKPAWAAAAAVSEAIASKLARKVQQSLGPIQQQAQMQYEHYRDLAQQFRVLWATDGRGVIPGGLAGVKPAGPILGGGGQTELGGIPYDNVYDGSGA